MRDSTRVMVRRRLGLRPRRAPIAIFSFNRPDYLAAVLDSFVAQDGGVAGREIHFFQDGAVNAYSGVRYATDEAIAECLAIRQAKLPGSVLHYSRSNIGVCENFLRAERHLFEDRGAEVAYFFEDDLILSPHYLAALDMLDETVRDEPRIGYFAAYGDHRRDLTKQRALRRKLIELDHHWAYGLKRSVWRAMQPVLAPYYGLVVGKDYRRRDNKAIFAAQRQFGLAHSASSQDAAKALSTAVIGTWRTRTVACYGRYIGARGIHFTPAAYERMGYAETPILTDSPEGFDLPTSAALDRSIEASRQFFRLEHEKQVAASERKES